MEKKYIKNRIAHLKRENEKIEHYLNLLDEADPIEDAYHLEVSSPGIERDLKNDMQINACIGWDVEVRLYADPCGRPLGSTIVSVPCGRPQGSPLRHGWKYVHEVDTSIQHSSFSIQHFFCSASGTDRYTPYVPRR